MNKNYQIESNKIIFENGIITKFEYEIIKTLKVNDIILVLIKKPFRVIYNRTIFAVSYNGNILWQVPDRDSYPGEEKDCPFVDMILNTEGNIVLFNWCSIAFVVDPNTGTVLCEYETR